MDAYPDEVVWKLAVDPDELLHEGFADKVQLITDEYFDTFLVDRLTGQWLGGNTTWVIAISTDIPFK
jgi:hypothetical protein